MPQVFGRRRILDADDPLMARELLEQGGRERQVCVLRDVVNQYRHGLASATARKCIASVSGVAAAEK